MAKVHWLGATYTDVPAVSLPDGDGGESSFTDVSDTTAQAADVAQGKQFFDALGVLTQGTASGGGTLITKTITENGTYSAQDDNADGYSEVTVNVSGGGEVEPNDVTFIDYDGTVLCSYTAAEALALTELPANPSHSGLTAQGWNYTLAQIKTEVNSVGRCVVGQMYITDDGKTRLYIHLVGDGEQFALYCRRDSNNISATIDWGDGSEVDEITATAQKISHTYSLKGEYMVQITVSDGNGNVRIGGGSSSTVGYGDTAHRPKLIKVELGTKTVIDGYGFYYCYGLKSITIPREATAFGNYALACCSGLDAVVIPSGWTTLNANLFYRSMGIKYVSMPCSITDIKGNVFQECYYLRSVIPSAVTAIGAYYRRSCYNSKDDIVIPSGVSSLPNYFAYDNALVEKITLGSITSIGQYALYGCFSLRKLDVPSSVTSINTYAFAACYNMLEYHFKSTTPPSLSNTNAFNNIPSNCKIYVPYSADHSILNAYKTDTNWSTYASYMVEEDAA